MISSNVVYATSKGSEQPAHTRKRNFEQTIKTGMRKFRIGQDFLIEHWHMMHILSVLFWLN